MSSFFDTLFYAVLSFSHVWMFLAMLMLVVKRRKFRALPWSRERRCYQAVVAISMVAWLWNGLRPTPTLFEDRAGLYWGIKLENVGWRPHTGGYGGQPPVAHGGTTSMAVQFGKSHGSLIFHHFPNSPPIGRYQAVGFCLLPNDLKTDPFQLMLYSDGKVPHPTDGLKLNDRYRSALQAARDPWACYQVPIADFNHPGGGIVGVAFGKSAGVDEGTFYLDDVRLIAKST